MDLRQVETPQAHVRAALELLDEIESQLRLRSVGIPADYGQGGSLAATRRRLWLAVAALESAPDAVRPRARWRRSARERGWPLRIGFVVVHWAVSALVFVLRGAWRSALMAVRLIYTLRAL